MTITGLQVAFYSVTFLLPGYITSYVVSQHRSRLRSETQLEFFRWLALSTLCLALPIGLLFGIFGRKLDNEHDAWIYVLHHRWWAAIIWLVTVLVFPIAVGKLLALVQDEPRSVLTYFVTKHPQAHDTAWDAKFASIDHTQGDWVMVFLNDGGWIAGKLQEGSHASIDPRNRDLYISLVEFTSTDAEFPSLTRSGGGVYVPAERIRFIRFWE